MSQLVAVIDLGKTNKKVALIDQRLQVVDHRSASFPAILDADGVLVEQTTAIETWLLDNLADLYRAHPFQALSVTTHGATWAAVADDGTLAIPVIAYEHDLGPAAQATLDADFARLCGPLDMLQDETGTCDLPLLINPAKMVLFAQQKYGARFARTAHLLNYPQFWGWRLTGALATEATYAANHSFLLDLRAKKPSTAAHTLGVAHAVDCAFKNPWDRLGTLTPEVQRRTGLPALPVTVGIHDSNGALLPYLIKNAGRDFVLNSTGTWCVAMHRVSEAVYRPDEIGQKVIFNIDALGGLTKVSFLMGGMDYGLYHGLIGGADPAFDAARVNATLQDHGRAILPGAYASQFPRRQGGLLEGGQEISLADARAGKVPAWFRDEAVAHDLLNVSLALQTEVALRRTGISNTTTIFVEGGFRNNPTFLGVLAALFPETTVACTDLAQATASGAALLGHALLAGTTPAGVGQAIVISERPVARPTIPGLAAYRAAWMAACA